MSRPRRRATPPRLGPATHISLQLYRRCGADCYASRLRSLEHPSRITVCGIAMIRVLHERMDAPRHL